ncbi:DNA transposition protein [Segnochrobactrum spirostomi]|uniref:DNA transposition protein n=1 Tax=Segnochrobactrum spirostomi TaxID=2608987 RepID=A0A6A7Y7V5_9HYPH|nr:DNA transposition protein [Segnochrobactrum spirostomi]MQT14417.1 DNA transposition protein [Segnochrobactrum spirostomi]
MSGRRKRPRAEQLSLLDWMPASPVLAYAAERVKAATLARSISKAVSETLKGCGRSRAEVARAMSDYLDDNITENVLNAYAAESRDDLIISITRLDALIAVTRDRRLLELLASRHGWAVIDRRHLPAIKMAELLEHREEVNAEIDYQRRQIRGGV